MIAYGSKYSIIGGMINPEELGTRQGACWLSSGVEPCHTESLSWVSVEELKTMSGDLGTAFDQMEAQYAGFVGGVDADVTDGWTGYSLPLAQACWEGLRDPCDLYYGGRYAATTHNGW